MKNNQIIHGDAAKALAELPGECVDLVVTDPPYLGRYRDRLGRTLANDDNPEAVMAVYPELYRVLKPGGYCVTFYGWVAIAEFAQAWKEAGFRSIGHIVWPKPYASKVRHTEYRHESAYLLAKGWPKTPANPLADVQPWEYSGNRSHPTEKALGVITPLIEAYSRPGDLVLDPFLGSGTTAVAAALSGRRYLGIELEKQYCDLARKRLAGVERYRRRCGPAHVPTPKAGGLAA